VSLKENFYPYSHELLLWKTLRFILVIVIVGGCLSLVVTKFMTCHYYNTAFSLRNLSEFRISPC